MNLRVHMQFRSLTEAIAFTGWRLTYNRLVILADNFAIEVIAIGGSLLRKKVSGVFIHMYVQTCSIAPYAFLTIMHRQEGLHSHSRTIVSIIYIISYLDLLTELQKVTNIQSQYQQLGWNKKEWK